MIFTAFAPSFAEDTEQGSSEDEIVEAGTYTLKEVDSPTGYEISDEEYTVTVASDNNVSISDSSGSVVEQDEEAFLVSDPPTSVDLDISKTVDGSFGDQSKLFDFDIALENAEADKEYSVTVSDEQIAAITTDENGVAAGTIQLKHGQTATVNDLPYNSKVVVSEPATEYIADYTVQADGRVIDRKINLHPNTEISTGTVTLDGNYSVSFTNTLNSVSPTGIPKTNKVLIPVAAALLGLLLAITRRLKKKSV